MSFTQSITSRANAYNLTICISLNNQQCIAQPTLINLHPNEYIQGLRYYPLALNLDRCMGSCNTINDLSNRACVANKSEDLDLRVFNVITGINEVAKSGVAINVGVSAKTQKNIMSAKNIIFGILLYAVVKMLNM